MMLTDRRSSIRTVRMSQPCESIVFSDPWVTQPAAGSNQSVPCLDDQCQLRFSNHDTRYEHYVASHPYSRPKSNTKKPFQCRLCRKAFILDFRLKIHIKCEHKPISRDSTVMQKDQEALILQSHAPSTNMRRSQAQSENEDVQGHRKGCQEEDTQEPLYPIPSRRASVLQYGAVQCLKRKGSSIIASLTKKARNASLPRPHAVTPAAKGVMEEE